jgi:hypothetical protein
MEDTKKYKFLTLPGLELQPLGRPTSSQSLYRLRYREMRFLKHKYLSTIKVIYNELTSVYALYFVRWDVMMIMDAGNDLTFHFLERLRKL